MSTETEGSLAELRSAIREVLDGRWDDLVVALKRGERRAVEEALWRDAAELGWFAVGLDESAGGLGLGLAGAAILYEELGRSIAPLNAIGPILTADVIGAAGNDEQRAEWLPQIAAGSLRIGVALPLAGEDVPVARADGRATGSAHHVLGDPDVDVFAVPVKTAADAVDLTLVRRDDPGVRVAAGGVIDLTRGMSSVALNDVALPPERRVPLTPAQWQHVADHVCVALALDSVGGGLRVLERTIAYMGQRSQFGRPIGSFQALKHRAASWKVALEGARALSIAAADVVATAAPGARAIASAAKASACDIYVGVAGDSIQLHGGIGFTWEHECHLFMKRARLNASLFGTSLQHRERVAAEAFAAMLAAPLPPRPLLAVGARP